MRGKWQEIAEWLAKRIRQGDYDLHGFPSGRLLATELKISQNTTYKVLDDLVEKGLLARKDTGRLEVRRAGILESHAGRVAFLQPRFSAEHFDMVAGVWHRAAEVAASSHQLSIRPLIYTDYGDSVIRDALLAFSGLLFLGMAAPIPADIIRMFQEHSRKVIVLGSDLSSHGIRSVRLGCSSHIHHLLDHLAELGHRQIDCLNVHPMSNHDVQDRIKNWELWKRAHGFQGRLICEPVEAAGVSFDRAFEQSYALMKREFAGERPVAAALFCIAMPGALGAMRAVAEEGLRVGKDISICAASDEGICRHLTPSVTSLTVPDALPYLDLCLENLAAQDSCWNLPLLLQPEEATLFAGDSTGPYRSSRNATIKGETDTR